MNDPHKFAVLWPLWEARLADYINGSNLRIDGGLDPTIDEVIGEEHRAAARLSISGAHPGPLMGLPASGKRVTLSLHEFHIFREGRISVTRHPEDWMGLFRQIGALPPSAI